MVNRAAVKFTAKMVWIILLLGGVALMRVEGASVEERAFLKDSYDAGSNTTDSSTVPSNVTGETTRVPSNVTGETTRVPSNVTGETTRVHSNVTGETSTLHSNVTGETSTLHSNVTGETSTVHSNVTGETSTPHSNVTGEATTVHSNVTELGNITTVTSPYTSHLSTGGTASPTPQPHKGDSSSFSVASFFGGMAVAAAVAIIIFVAVRCYNMKKKSNYHAM